MGGNSWIYLLIFIVVVVLINLGLVSMLRSSHSQKQTGLFRKLFQDMRHPYRKEDQMLNELSRRVAGLKQTDQKKPDKNDVQG
jgi:hypothetical protein